MDNIVTGAKLIAAERRRQIHEEGWLQSHDAEHDKGELLSAAGCYLYFGFSEVKKPPRTWPWEVRWWKPSTDRTRTLVKVGALIAAEIDRRLYLDQQKLGY